MLEANQFSVHMMPVNFLDELQRQEMMSVRQQTVDAAIMMGTTLNLPQTKWLGYVAKEYGGVPEEMLPDLEKAGIEMDVQTDIPLSPEEMATLDSVMQRHPELQKLLQERLFIGTLRSDAVPQEIEEALLPEKGGADDPVRNDAMKIAKEVEDDKRNGSQTE